MSDPMLIAVALGAAVGVAAVAVLAVVLWMTFGDLRDTQDERDDALFELATKEREIALLSQQLAARQQAYEIERHHRAIAEATALALALDRDPTAAAELAALADEDYLPTDITGGHEL